MKSTNIIGKKLAIDSPTSRTILVIREVNVFDSGAELYGETLDIFTGEKNSMWTNFYVSLQCFANIVVKRKFVQKMYNPQGKKIYNESYTIIP